ncbi:MAG: hypothetical protein V1851_03320 [Patescibacteria group bacterium]
MKNLNQEKLPRSFILILVSQAMFMLFSILVIVTASIAGGWNTLYIGYTLVLGIIMYPILGIIGIIQGTRYLLKKKHKSASIFLITISLIMVAFFIPNGITIQISDFISSFFFNIPII